MLMLSQFSWSDLKFYCSPPYSCVLRAVKKIIQESAKGIIVIPDWQTQPWYPLLAALNVHTPVILNPSPNLLLTLCQSPEAKHPLCKKMILMYVLYPATITKMGVFSPFSRNYHGLVEG